MGGAMLGAGELGLPRKDLAGELVAAIDATEAELLSALGQTHTVAMLPHDSPRATARAGIAPNPARTRHACLHTLNHICTLV